MQREREGFGVVRMWGWFCVAGVRVDGTCFRVVGVCGSVFVGGLATKERTSARL